MIKGIDLNELTPVVEIENNIYLKRDDLFEYNGCYGGKVRGALYIIEKAIEQGYDTFVSVGSRFSPQCEIISFICEKIGVKCHLFMPGSKEKTSVMLNIEQNKNTTLHYIYKGAYTNVLISYAKKYAAENDFYFINFGMEMDETIDILAKQVQNIPNGIKRIIVPVGSGMNFCAIANGLIKYNKNDIQIVGIQVGKDPTKIINKYFPQFDNSKHIIIQSPYKYEKQLLKNIGDIKLDPIYEAKCVDFLEKGDLFWIVGKRK